MGLVSKVMKFRLLLKIPRGFLSNGIICVSSCLTVCLWRL